MRKLLWLIPAVLLLLLAYLAPPSAQPAGVSGTLRDSGPKLVALTFDDGPRRATTSRLLDGLSQRGVRATFFLIGKQVPGNEDLVRRMAEEGHQVGIHTYDHVSLQGLSPQDLEAQVGRTRTLLAGITGSGELMLRPPYGQTDEALLDRCGCPVLLWSVDPEDWHNRDVSREVAHIVTQVQDGDIILLHDIFPESVDAALQAVDLLHQAGFSFLTAQELLEARGITPQPGHIYRHAPPG